MKQLHGERGRAGEKGWGRGERWRERERERERVADTQTVSNNLVLRPVSQYGYNYQGEQADRQADGYSRNRT